VMEVINEYFNVPIFVSCNSCWGLFRFRLGFLTRWESQV
jgi:hypothetical protein